MISPSALLAFLPCALLPIRAPQGGLGARAAPGWGRCPWSSANSKVRRRVRCPPQQARQLPRASTAPQQESGEWERLEGAYTYISTHSYMYMRLWLQYIHRRTCTRVFAGLWQGSTRPSSASLPRQLVGGSGRGTACSVRCPPPGAPRTRAAPAVPRLCPPPKRRAPPRPRTRAALRRSWLFRVLPGVWVLKSQARTNVLGYEPKPDIIKTTGT